MRFIHDKQVKFAWVSWFVFGWQGFAKEAQRPLAFQEVYRGNQAREVRPGIDMQPALAPQELQQVAIDDAKFQAKFVAHLVAPLYLECGWTDNEYLAGAVTDDEFLADQSSLDGFTQTDIVGNKQIDARHLDSTCDRIKLVILNLNATAKR